MGKPVRPNLVRVRGGVAASGRIRNCDGLIGGTVMMMIVVITVIVIMMRDGSREEAAAGGGERVENTLVLMNLGSVWLLLLWVESWVSLVCVKGLVVVVVVVVLSLEGIGVVGVEEGLG